MVNPKDGDNRVFVFIREIENANQISKQPPTRTIQRFMESSSESAELLDRLKQNLKKKLPTESVAEFKVLYLVFAIVSIQ